MVSAAGLGAAFGGFQDAQAKGDKHNLSEFALLDAQLDQAGAAALGKTFQSLSMPGAQQIGGGPPPPPMGGPPQSPGQMGGPPPQPPMQPGQPSVPMQQPGGFAGRFGGDPGQGPGMMQGGGQRLSTAMQGAPQMQPGGGPPPQGPPPGQPGQQAGGNMPQPQGQFDLQTAAQAIARANPGIRPEVLVHALNKAMPYLNAQAQDSVRKATIELREQNLYTRERIADQQSADRRRGQDAASDRADQADETKRRGQDMSFAAQRERTAASIKNAETRAQSGQNIQDEAKVIVDGIEKGITPPSLVGLYRARPAVEAEASRRGINLTQAQLEFKRAEKQISTLNGPQMTRFSGLATSVVNTIDEVRDLSKQMNLSGIPLLNKVELEAYAQTRGNTPEGQLVAKYVGAINTLKEEFANLAQGGYAPTESVWKLANKQINENYGVKQLGASLDEIQRLINYRVQAVPGMKQLGPGAPNRYTDTGGPGGGGELKPIGASELQEAQAALKTGRIDIQGIIKRFKDAGYDTSDIEKRMK